MTGVPRLFLEWNEARPPKPGARIALPPAEAHHVMNVLRLAAGAHVTVCLRGSTLQFDTILVSDDKHGAVVSVVRAATGGNDLGIVRRLICALPKGQKADLICEKCTELNVRDLIFWHSKHSVTRLSEEKSGARAQRLLRVVEAAAKQCGRTSLPSVKICDSANDLFEHLTRAASGNDALRLILSLQPGSLPMREFPAPNAVDISVGPEGDFTPEEHNRFVENGFKPCSLGNLTLRCETAAIAAASIANGLWGSAA